MSATSQSAELEVSRRPAGNGRQAAALSFAPGHEALQALLAFSALHEQIRQRRAHEAQSGNRAKSDVWELEHFVLDEVLQLVAERALSITGADGVAIALAEADAIICRGSAGTIAPDQAHACVTEESSAAMIRRLMFASMYRRAGSWAHVRWWQFLSQARTV
jgi:hypothetical protein